MSDLAPTRSTGPAAPGTSEGRVSIPRVVVRWMVGFAGFPLGGLLTDLVVGPVDGPFRAVLGGLLTGAALGTVQAWALGRRGIEAGRWIVASAIGLAVGLLVGATTVGYGTDRTDLVVLGALCGAAVGAAQAIVLAPALGRRSLAWPVALAGAWALGWTITSAVGVQVEEQFSVFGSSGAVVVTALTAVLPVVLARRASQTRSAR